MSGFLGIVAANLATVLLRRPRKIGLIVPNVVLEEIGTDDLDITDHPIEVGTPISDHAFRKPAELVMRVGWSNSAPLSVMGIPVPGLSQGLATAITSFGENDYVTDVYEELRLLQEEREPFDVMTGKRLYRNMLIRSMVVTTDETTENTLMVQVRMREVIIVRATVSAVPPEEDQEEPEDTSEVEDAGPACTNEAELPEGAGPDDLPASPTPQGVEGPLGLDAPEIGPPDP